MAKDILLYGSIWQYQAMFFFEQVAEVVEENPKAEMALRINCEGGEPEYGMSIIEKVIELADQIFCKVGAQCHSMALFLLCYVDTSRTECIDTTTAVLHRGAYPSWLENSPTFKGSLYETLMVKMNQDLERAFRAAVDIAALESLPQFKDAGITLADIFDTSKRLEVVLTAADLKKIGLVSKINKITPSQKTQMKTQFETFKKCASLGDYKMAAQASTKEKSKDDEPTIENMTAEEIKAKFPAVHAQIMAEGHKEGVAAGVASERDRVEAIMVYADVDPDGCKKAVEEGKPLTQKQLAEFSRKALSADALKRIEDESAEGVKTDEPKNVGKKEKEIATFEAQVNKNLGIKKDAVKK
jgi:ATP-dependent protease ClpP protease subunit